MKRKAWLTVAVALLLPVTALAAETFDGTVVAGVTTDVTAPFGGTVQSVSVREGAYLAVGDVAAVLDTTKVYAPEDGGDDPELEAAAALVEGHYRKKLEAGRRDLVIAALQRRGFSYSVIKEAVRRIEEE